jgi:hypothetical protein
MVTEGGTTFRDDSDIIDAVTTRNNIFFNDGTGADGTCFTFWSDVASTTHSNNNYYRSFNPAFDVTYVNGAGQTPAQTLTWEATAVVTDPVFKVEFTNLHPSIGSPVIGQGIAISGIITDFEGVTLSDPPNMGAYETAE